MFKRRPGTAGICGHLYETKLLSLLYFRAIHDERIVDFKLASNVDNIGAFDDICLKVVVGGGPVCLFIQAKHKENEKRTLKIELEKYFLSYLKIRQHFNPSNNDSLFSSTFDETECLFVIYTTAKDELGDNPVTSSFSSHLYQLIGTGGTAKQANRRDRDVELLSKTAFEEQVTSLAARIAKLIMDQEKFEMILTEELVQRYHVALAQTVVHVSEVQPEGHRVASFRREFFDTREEHLIHFRDTLYKEILKKRKIAPTDIERSLSELLDASTGDKTETLSKVIGTVVIYNNGRLDISKHYQEYFKPGLYLVNVSPSTASEAVERAAKQILLSPMTPLKVPAAFGNKDLLISGGEVKKQKRINYLKSKLTVLLNKYRASKIVTIDDSLESGFLQHSGGLASAVGNIFVLDNNTKLIKITDNRESLGAVAVMLYDRLYDEISDLHEYRFCFKVSKFPKLVLKRDSYEDNLARDFLNKLIIYSSQADEKAVEEKIRDEIEEKLEQSDCTPARTEAIYLKYHNEIQTWWKLPQEAPYLTREDTIFDKATRNIIEDPLMRAISVPYINKITQFHCAFSEDAVRSLNLQEQHSSTVIITENTALTVVKVMQYLHKKQHVVLDLNYIVNLTTKERNALRRELASTNIDKVIIFVCNEIQNSSNEKKTFENVAGAVRNKKTIIITNRDSVDTLRTYFKECTGTVYDKKNSLVHMSEETQRIVLENARVRFQGQLHSRTLHYAAAARPPSLSPASLCASRVSGTSDELHHVQEATRDGRDLRPPVRDEATQLVIKYFRAIHDKRIVDFKLASNVDNIGAFDDICLKVVVGGGPVCLFIQAKHKENEKRTLKIELEKYFLSYLKIRQHFNPSNSDSLFSSTFDETECLFVIYTTAKDELGDNPVTSSFSSHLYQLIGTGGTAKQANRRDRDVELLSKTAFEEQVTSLAARIAKLIMDQEKFEMILTEELVQRYHVVLAQTVVHVSEVQPEGHRVASFRREFFDTREEHLIHFRDTLYKEILKKRKIAPTDIERSLSELLDASTGDKTETLSKVIGTVVIYNNGRLDISKHYKEYFKPGLHLVNVSPSTASEAVERAAKQILLSSMTPLKVPAAFGNKDLLLSGGEVKKQKRINYLKSKLTVLLNKYRASKIVTIDDSLGSGFLQHSGGLASAVGNIFVLDDNTKLIKITDNRESLGAVAVMLYDRLYDEISDLHEYRFCLKVSKFPKLVLKRDSYEDNLARDFLNKLIIYSSQADEKAVEEKIRDEIEEQLEQSDCTPARTEAIYLKYHNEIQTWWMLPQEAPYLTREDTIFDKATQNIIEDPLMRAISVPYINKITQFHCAFSEDAVRSLNLQEQHSSTVIITENTALTVVKVMQYLHKKQHVVLDLNYIVNLTTKERNALRRELASTNMDKVIIFVCNEIQNSSNEKKTFENVAGAVRNKKTIIITNRDSVDTLRTYFKECTGTVYDKKNSLVHMSEETQRIVLENARVRFQGMEAALGALVRGWPRSPGRIVRVSS